MSMKTNKKVGKATSRLKEPKPEITVKTMYLDGFNTFSESTGRRSGKGIQTSKANMKVNPSKSKNKENNMCITYKSLNQRITGQIYDNKELKAVDTNKSLIKDQRHKVISSINFRTKQNSPHKIIAQDSELTGCDFQNKRMTLDSHDTK